jgi:hypothetical protein
MTPNYASAIQVLAPTAEWTMTDVTNYNTLSWHSTDSTKPSKEALDTEVSRQVSNQPLQACVDKAKSLLAASDWSVLPDVNISNKAEFETYRAALRALVFNPVAEPTFPTEPQPVWI